MTQEELGDNNPDDDRADDLIIGVMLRRSLIVIIVIVLMIAGTIYWSSTEPVSIVRETELATVEIREQPTLTLPLLPFTEITSQAGIDFLHENAAAGEKLMPETMGSGCAFLDFDNDGDQDILLVNVRRWPWDASLVSGERKPTMGLYQNDGSGNFQDVTAGSGLDVSFFGTGVAVGDYDGDSLVDIYLTAVGRNHLFHNEGEGRFRDVTEETGTAGGEKEWGTSCGWFDYDRDGDLDLFVCNYIVWSREFDLAQDFQLTGGQRAYGRPQNFEGTFPDLYRNHGDGRFAEVSEDAGLDIRTPTAGDPMAKSLGVVFADFDGDDWLDIVVANDTVQNFLFHNQQDGTFEEIGALAGVAFDMDGNARGAMGIDVAAFRSADGLGIAIGNFANEMTALYVTEASEMAFVDEAISSGLGPNTRLQLTFRFFYFDADLDGRLDLFAANGHLEDDINRVQPSQYYEQSPQLFWNCGPEHATEFLPLSDESLSSDFLEPLVGRGASYADIDGDGDLDVLMTSVGQPPRLLRNDQQIGHHWLRLKLIGTTSHPDGIGAEITLEAGGVVQKRLVSQTRSYQSQVELPVTFGLGGSTSVDKLTIHWPSGTVQTMESLEADQFVTIRELAGSASLPE